MSESTVADLLDRFRGQRRAFEQKLHRLPKDAWSARPPDGGRSPRDMLIVMRAWIDEANEWIPRLMAGAVEPARDPQTFNTEAFARTRDWTVDQAAGAFRRAADRFDTMIAESNARELAEEPAVMRWIELIANDLMNGLCAE
jgi:hypothetical protein